MKLAFAVLLMSAGCALAEEPCLLDSRAAPDMPLRFAGVVRGPATSDEVAAQTAIAVARVHAPLAMGYDALPRVFVYYVDGGVRHGTIAAVLNGSPGAGETVTLSSRHRDPNSPCAFVPWTVTPGTPEKPTS